MLCTHIVRFLSEIYFIAVIRHPIRNLIARNFDKMTAYQSIIIDSLVDTVKKSYSQLNSSSSAHELNSMVTSLEGFLENFHFGALSLHQCFDEVFQVVCMAIAKYLAEIE